MSKTALFFPGQASQYVGMGKDLYDQSVEVKKLYEIASDALGADIAKISFDGPAEELKKTRFTQPAILLHSLAVMIVIGNENIEFDYACGHSLGEYSALAATGAISYQDAIKAVCTRATLMEDACIKNQGTMAAIVGLASQEVEEICEKASAVGIVVVANYNSSNTIVISGELVAIDKAIEYAREAGAKIASIIEVGGAFHSPLMEPAKEGMVNFLDNIEFKKPSNPVVANVTANEHDHPEKISSLLVEQITSPVKWSQTVSYLSSCGVSTIIEIGPGKVLGKMARREKIFEEIISLDKFSDVESFTAATV